MLSELEGRESRRGRYVCVLAAISPDGDEVLARGELRRLVRPRAER